jgi:hypothetical protein
MAVKLFLAIPNYRESVSGRFLDCMTRLSVHLARRFGPGELQYMRVGLMYIDIARNMVWEQARKCGAENLLCIDDDMTFTPEIFDTLWDTPGDVISALYFIRRQPPTAPCMYLKSDAGPYLPIPTYPQDTVMEVDAVGLGFALIRKPVLDALKDPFTKETRRGEDIIFCEKARAAGFSVQVNTAAKAGHLITLPIEINESNASHAASDLLRAT